MSDTDDETDTRESEAHSDAADDGTHGHLEPSGPRETAPMSAFTARAAGIGVVILVVGLVVTVALPVVFT